MGGMRQCLSQRDRPCTVSRLGLALFELAGEGTDGEGKRNPDTGHNDSECPLDVPQVLIWCGEVAVVDCSGGQGRRDVA